jgi:hypothetical protein
MATSVPTPRRLRLQFPHEYNCWRSMRNRCTNPRNRSWRYYGAVGVRVCRRWDRSFEAFVADLGAAPSWGHSIDRIKNEVGYQPGNCRWATSAEQQANTSKVRWIEFRGVRRSKTEWAALLGISAKTLQSRLDDLGWTVERALTTPTLTRFRQRNRRLDVV